MKIAVFLPNWIGDAVMATPALRAVRKHFRGAHVVGVMKPYVAGVLEGGRFATYCGRCRCRMLCPNCDADELSGKEP